MPPIERLLIATTDGSGISGRSRGLGGVVPAIVCGFPVTSVGGFSVSRLTDHHFAGLLGVRSAIAVFERTGEREARSVGATHAQHHVLLALRGHRDREDAPTVKDVAAALGVASPSAVELIGRMVGAGLLERRPDGRDARLTRLHLTALGQGLVTELSEGHLPRLRELTRRGVELLRD